MGVEAPPEAKPLTKFALQWLVTIVLGLGAIAVTAILLSFLGDPTPEQRAAAQKQWEERANKVYPLIPLYIHFTICGFVNGDYRCIERNTNPRLYEGTHDPDSLFPNEHDGGLSNCGIAAKMLKARLTLEAPTADIETVCLPAEK